MSDNIKVVVKVRPLITRELEDKSRFQWSLQDNTLTQLDHSGNELGQSFTFDKVYGQDTKTYDVYHDVAHPIVEAAVSGINGTIFAYGQTSSGKTYTMTGTEDSPGIIPLAVLNLFKIIQSKKDRDFLVRVSYIEIYNEMLKDLLNVEKKIKIHETHSSGIKVDATEKVTSSPDEVISIMKEGEANRQIGATNMNEQSSRSHSIFQITIESREHTDNEDDSGCVNVSILNLVDLAGSERAGQTGVTGIRFREGTHINKSLLYLAIVIKQLSEDPQRFVNYRDSKLTRILQNSLGGNAKTSIICAVTPAAGEETLSTLQFACRAKAIKNKPKVNAVATSATMIQKLTKQLSLLQLQLENKRSLEQDNQMLQRKIAALQCQILNGVGERGGRRRAGVAPRRATIHAIRDDEREGLEPDRVTPRFATPALKYNPSNFPDFLSSSSGAPPLPRVSEEPAGQVTPPPARKKTVNFDTNIIDLDSDEDTTVQTCSPYHKCYDSSKTPPCILREKAKKAEKNFQEIVDLTVREKIYTPTVEELMMKLEHNTNVITKLEDEVNNLNEKCKEKDSQLDNLQTKITESDSKMKEIIDLKEKLENQCEEFNTKLTDMEVSYDTLKKKYNTREDEVLLLLEDRKIAPTNNIGKSQCKGTERDLSSFMDLSKDISLVNSDVENSIIQKNDDENLQATHKIDLASDLEAKLISEQRKITDLQQLNEKMQNLLDDLNTKMKQVEEENSCLKSSSENLQTTMKKQQEDLEMARNDIISYNSLIQELQLKLSQRENRSNLIKDDTVLQNMIADEEHLLNNNENLRTIIQTLKQTIDQHNAEINKINAGAQVLECTIMDKQKQIEDLTGDIENVNQQIAQSLLEINKLTESNNAMLSSQTALVEELNTLKSEKSKFQEINNNNIQIITDLRHTNDQNENVIVDQKTQLKQLQMEFDKKSDLIKSLEDDIQSKVNLIDLLNCSKYKTEESISKLQLCIIRIQSLLALFNEQSEALGCTSEVYDADVAFAIIDSGINRLESAIIDCISQKETCSTLKNEVETITLKYQKKIEELQTQVGSLASSQCDSCEKLAEDKTVLKQNIESVKEELESKSQENIDMQRKLEENFTHKEYLEKIVEEKDKKILELTKCHGDCMLNTQVVLTSLKSEQNSNLLKQYHEVLASLEKSEANCVKNENILKVVHNKIMSAVNELNIQSCDEQIQKDNEEEIVIILEKLTSQLNFITQEHNGCSSKFDKALSEVHAQVEELTCLNSKLSADVVQYKNEQEQASLELDLLLKENNNLNANIAECNTLLLSLQEQISEKANEYKSLETIINKNQEDYTNMKNTLEFKITQLETENCEIRTQHTEHEKNAMGIRKSLSSIIETNEGIVPDSLARLCCSRIIDILNTNESELNSVSTSSSSANVVSVQKETQTSELVVNNFKEENDDLKNLLEFYKTANRQLIEEQEEVRRELNLLVEPTKELQKRITNHRTNLSTLTATTYAENKALKSQVKVLQYYHTRLHSVCQKDMPVIKQQLIDVFKMLKSEEDQSKQTNPIKRYSLPDVLDKSTGLSALRNESTLDGDLLMLDTNVTLASVDNTLVVHEHDQTCFDITENYLENDIPGPSELNTVPIQKQMEDLTCENLKLAETLNIISKENTEMKNKIQDLNSRSLEKDNVKDVCVYCQGKQELQIKCDQLSDELSQIRSEKIELNENLKTVSDKLYSHDDISYKLSALEKENQSKVSEISKLTNTLSQKNRELKQLQEENDTLSNQLMENITEADDLKKELDQKIEDNKNLLDEIEKLSRSQNSYLESQNICPQCLSKNKVSTKQCSENNLSKNKTPKDMDTSSKYDKIFSLQNELCASCEDCQKITEEVATIKNHLERSNLFIAQNLDDSMGESNIFAFTKDFESVESQTTNKFSTNVEYLMSQKDQDTYALDRAECLNYYFDKTGSEKENLNTNLKIIDVMRMLYNNIFTKHGNEVENLRNKLRDFEEITFELQTKLSNVTENYSKVCIELKENQSKIDISELLRNGILALQEITGCNQDSDKNSMLVSLFKENVLGILDKEYSLSTLIIFESIINSITTKHQNDLHNIRENYNKLQQYMEALTTELTNVKENLIQMKGQLSDKEAEYNLLKAQKDKVSEISNAVTLDIIKKEKELNETIRKGCSKLLEYKIMNPNDIDLSLPLNENVNIIFERLISQYQMRDQQHQTEIDEEKQNLIDEIKKLQFSLQEKEKDLVNINLQKDQVSEINNMNIAELANKESELQKLMSSNSQMKNELDDKIQQNNEAVYTIENMKDEIMELKENIKVKENKLRHVENDLAALRNDSSESKDLILKITHLEAEHFQLKSINELITQEKEQYANELNTAKCVIENKNKELEKMTTDVLDLKASIENSSSLIETLKKEVKDLLDQNKHLNEESTKLLQLRQMYEDKCKEYSVLELNIKTHEKTVEIQSSMIIRLQKQKEDDSKLISEKVDRINMLADKIIKLRKETEEAQLNLKSTKEEFNKLLSSKEALEIRLAAIEAEVDESTKNKLSMDANSSRRRRQSIHDSKRVFAEDKQDFEDHNKLEEMFGTRDKPDDLFMEVDDEGMNRSKSNRSSLSKRRDSQSWGRPDQGDKDCDPPSRPSSAAPTRRRRQSTHDLHRSLITPSPRESLQGTRLNEKDERQKAADNESELVRLRIELSELRAAYRELDEECDTCAEYLRDYERTNHRLRKDKAALETTIAELKLKIGKPVDTQEQVKATFANASVNTEEDWNLHSVVVDRMSFDLEVEKNKKLTKAMEEFHLKNRELKVTIMKMQRAMDKYSAKEGGAASKELESTRKELSKCKSELEELKLKYSELDAEYETCADYLRDREQQCARLRDVVDTLKLEGGAQSSRQKRRGLHDQRRDAPHKDYVDDCSHLQEDDNSQFTSSGDTTRDVKRLSMMVEKLSAQKSVLEQQLAAHPLRVATGSAIVQNQQLTDIMKENQKLKRINTKLVAICQKRGKELPDDQDKDISEQS